MERKRRGRDQTAPFVSEDDGDFDFNALPRSPLTAVFSSFRGRSEAPGEATQELQALLRAFSVAGAMLREASEGCVEAIMQLQGVVAALSNLI